MKIRTWLVVGAALLAFKLAHRSNAAAMPVDEQRGDTTDPESPEDSAAAGRDASSWHSRGSLGSARSIGSIGSFWSIGSIGSSFSIGSIGSSCSIGSIGSFASVGSIVSVGSMGSFASAGGLFSSRARFRCAGR